MARLAPQEFSLDEVSQAVSSVPCVKSSGPDGVWAEHLHYGGPTLLSCLTAIFNDTVATGHVPASFAYRIHAGIPTNTSIALSCAICKVLEDLLCLLPLFQLSLLWSGFRFGQSCVHTASVLQEAYCLLARTR